MSSDRVFDIISRQQRLAAFDRAWGVIESHQPEPPVASVLNPDWQYLPASTHGDVANFAARQRERMRRIAK